MLGASGPGRNASYAPAALLHLSRRPLDVGRRFALLRVPQPPSVGLAHFPLDLPGRCRRAPCPARPVRPSGLGRDPRANLRPVPPGPGPPRPALATSARSARCGVGRAGCGSPPPASAACPPAACADRPIPFAPRSPAARTPASAGPRPFPKAAPRHATRPSCRPAHRRSASSPAASARAPCPRDKLHRIRN